MKAILTRLSKRAALIVCPFAACILVGAWAWPRQAHVPRVLRVGADNAPPYHTVQADGLIQGFAVDVLNEAARLKHIRLIWVPVTDITFADALARGAVDVWPALSPTPEREKSLHFSKPWLESTYCLLSRRESNITRQTVGGATLGVAAAPRVAKLAAKFFPEAHRVSMPNNLAVVQAVCKGDLGAGFLDARTLDSVLLDRPEGCETAPLRIHFVSEASNPVGMAGQPQSAALIDELRDGITPLITNGVFSDALDRWSGFSGPQTRSYFETREAQLRADVYFYAVLLLASGGGLLAWQMSQCRKADRRAEQAARAAAESETRFAAFMDHSPLVSFVKDEEGRMLYVNRRYLDVFEQSKNQCIGKNDFEIWPAKVATKIRTDDLMVLRENQCSELLDSVPAGSGELRNWLCVKFPFRINGNKFLGGVALDVTERERTKEAIRISEERFRSAFSNAAIGMAVSDSAGTLVEVNLAFCVITGYPQEELLGRELLKITHPDDRVMTLRVAREALESGLNSYRAENRYLRKDSSTIWVRNSVGVVKDGAGQPTHHISLIEDITIEKQAEEAALLSEQRWQLALHGTSDGIWDWDARNNTVFFSTRWKEMLGFEDHELENRPETWVELIHPQDREYAMSAVAAHLDMRTAKYQAEFRLRCKDGRYKWVLARGKAIWDAAGKPARLIGTHTDITDRKDAEERLLYEANHDALTGLVNRRCFLSRLEAEVGKAHLSSDSLSLCICDIDQFKGVNDREGHQSGDDVLRVFGEILGDGIRNQDLAGRVGGDEFFVLLPRTDPREAVQCMERVRSRLETIAFSGNTNTVFGVTASFGIATLCQSQGSDDLIAAADRALYNAKELGRNTTVVV